MIFGTLKWSGRAWPAAFVGKTVHIVYKNWGGGPRTSSGEAFEIQTTGKGREYHVFELGTWWRNFGELDLADPDAVIGFVRRKGDPFGQLSAREPTDTSLWPQLVDPLKEAAACWTDNRTGLSVLTDSDLKQREAIRHLAHLPPFRHGIQYVPYLEPRDGRLNLRIIPENLASFMVFSALQQLEMGTKMMVCKQCGDWFSILRRGARFCSPSCRAAHSTSKKEKK